MNTICFRHKNVKMIAHRGLSVLEKENTCSAFVAAANRSYYGIETDVHKTSDGRFVLIHDDTTDRVSGGRVKVNVEKSTYEELSKIILTDVNKRVGREDLRIPLLRDYLGICQRYKKICVIELKNEFQKEDIVSLTEEIKKIRHIENVIFISFSLKNCIELKKILPDSQIQWIFEGEITDSLIETLTQYKLDVDVEYHFLTKQNVKLFHSNGIKVNCWTCDNENSAKELEKMGVDFITTNILE